jgi:RNA polymerase sigma-70 factor (ECF subfamily)
VGEAPEPSDEALAARAASGDRIALDALLRRHYDRIAALCRRLAGNPVDAEDATQEALCAIVRGLPGFDGSARFGTWAWRVATNACLDELRRRARRPTPGLPADHVAAEPALAEAVATRLDVDAALSAVPEVFRVPVVLRDLLGLDYATIAAVLGVPPGTVRSRIARGRGLLADLLGNPVGPPQRRSDRA